MNNYLFLFLILIVVLSLPFFIKIKLPEGFTNYTLEETITSFTSPFNQPKTFNPKSNANVLVNDIYPRTNRNGISNNNVSEIWWHYPTLEVGSYAQITNNIRYPNNPDVGECMPASMCGALYKERHLDSNYIKQLPPINPNCGPRVGYFTTDKDLLLLPYRTNIPNVLY